MSASSRLTEVEKMTIQEIRRANLIELIDTLYNGVQKKFAESMGMEPSQVSRYVKGHRPIGSELARKIEGSMDKPTGWMDSTSNDLDDLDAASADLKSYFDTISIRPVISWGSVEDFVNGSQVTPERVWAMPPETSKRGFLFQIEKRTFSELGERGDLVGVDPDKPPQPGDYVLAKLDQGPVTIAIYHPAAGGFATFSMAGAPEPFKTNDFTILGPVVLSVTLVG